MRLSEVFFFYNVLFKLNQGRWVIEVVVSYSGEHVTTSTVQRTVMYGLRGPYFCKSDKAGIKQTNVLSFLWQGFLAQWSS